MKRLSPRKREDIADLLHSVQSDCNALAVQVIETGTVSQEWREYAADTLTIALDRIVQAREIIERTL